MTLSRQQLKALYQATLSAYPTKSQLQRDLSFEMGITLDTVADGENHGDRVFQLIQFLKSKGRLLEWIAVAQKQNPTHAEIQACADSVRSLLSEWRRKSERDSLLKLLRDGDDRDLTLQPLIKRVYKLCCPKTSLDALPSGIPATIEALQDLPQGNGNSYKSLHQFVALLLTLPGEELEADLAMRGREWLQDKVNNLDGILQAAHALWQDAETRAKAAQEAHLLIHVTQQSRSHSVSALLITDVNQYDRNLGSGCQKIFPSLADPGEVSDRSQDPRPEQVTLESLPGLVRSYINAANDAGDDDQELVVHLILPMDWLQENCDRWPCAEFRSIAIPTGTRYPLVVRIAERLERGYLNQFGKPWRDNWAALQKLQSGIGSAFVLGDGLAAGALYAQLNQTNKHGLKLTKSCDQTQFEQFFSMVIATGTPVALWLRPDECAESVVAVQASQAIDTLLNCKIATLPETVRQCRSGAMDVKQTAHIGSRLALLWEDPKLIPPPELPLKMPA